MTVRAADDFATINSQLKLIEAEKLKARSKPADEPTPTPDLSALTDDRCGYDPANALTIPVARGEKVQVSRWWAPPKPLHQAGGAQRAGGLHSDGVRLLY